MTEEVAADVDTTYTVMTEGKTGRIETSSLSFVAERSLTSTATVDHGEEVYSGRV